MFTIKDNKFIDSDGTIVPIQELDLYILSKYNLTVQEYYNLHTYGKINIQPYCIYCKSPILFKDIVSGYIDDEICRSGSCSAKRRLRNCGLNISIKSKFLYKNKVYELRSTLEFWLALYFSLKGYDWDYECESIRFYDKDKYGPGVGGYWFNDFVVGNTIYEVKPHVEWVSDQQIKICKVHGYEFKIITQQEINELFQEFSNVDFHNIETKLKDKVYSKVAFNFNKFDLELSSNIIYKNELVDYNSLSVNDKILVDFELGRLDEFGNSLVNSGDINKYNPIWTKDKSTLRWYVDNIKSDPELLSRLGGIDRPNYDFSNEDSLREYIDRFVRDHNGNKVKSNIVDKVVEIINLNFDEKLIKEMCNRDSSRIANLTFILNQLK